jgi:heme/copper-type cytochrome/quinol oxidase subunit 2
MSKLKNRLLIWATQFLHSEQIWTINLVCSFILLSLAAVSNYNFINSISESNRVKSIYRESVLKTSLLISQVKEYDLLSLEYAWSANEEYRNQMKMIAEEIQTNINDLSLHLQNISEVKEQTKKLKYTFNREMSEIGATNRKISPTRLEVDSKKFLLNETISLLVSIQLVSTTLLNSQVKMIDNEVNEAHISTVIILFLIVSIVVFTFVVYRAQKKSLVNARQEAQLASKAKSEFLAS